MAGRLFEAIASAVEGAMAEVKIEDAFAFGVYANWCHRSKMFKESLQDAF